MKIKEVSYSKVFSLGNFENHKIGFIAEIEDGDNIAHAMNDLVKKVEQTNACIRANKQIVSGLVSKQEAVNEAIRKAEADLELPF